MHDLGGHASKDRLVLDAPRAAQFIRLLAEALEPETLNDDFPPFTGTEGRRKVALHVTIERSSQAAALRKRMDGYRCQVCGLKFDEMYGVLGTGVAEAHHVVPLAKLKRAQKPNVADLCTVCANCHRMLHRMRGEGGDLDSLRQIILENRNLRDLTPRS